MSDINIRVKRSLRVLTDSSKPRHKRIVKALKAFQGLDLGSISKEAKVLIETSMVRFNSVLESYELKNSKITKQYQVKT